MRALEDEGLDGFCALEDEGFGGPWRMRALEGLGG